MWIQKSFDQWAMIKKRLNGKDPSTYPFFHSREVWWCSLGVNIGYEIDGKHVLFERPVLILHKFNKHLLWVVPLTSKYHEGIHFSEVHHPKGISYACVSQLRVVSSKRLISKIGSIPITEFNNVCLLITNLLIKK